MTLLDPVIQYYITYGFILVIITLALNITYLFISNFASLKSAYMCTSLKNTLFGNISKCFSSRLGSTCKQSDIGYTHGWCNDTDNYGPLRGTSAGPFSVKCNDWIWNNQDCPPDSCPDINGNKWGWCADKGVNRAMQGKACGPLEGKCENWIWSAKKCSETCDSGSSSATCTEDSCICSTVKARYVIVKLADVKSVTPKIDVYDTTGILIASASLLKIDLKDDKPIGKVIITKVPEDTVSLVGAKLTLSKSDNSIVIYRTISTAQDSYIFDIAKPSLLPSVSLTPAPPVPVPTPVVDKDRADKLAADKMAMALKTTSKAPYVMPKRFRIKSNAKFNMCLDDGGGEPGKSLVKLSACDPNSINQHFNYVNGVLVNADRPNRCIQSKGAKKPLIVNKCNIDSKEQQFTYADGAFKNATGNVCIDDGGGTLNSQFTIWDCEKNNNQGFELVDAPAPVKPAITWSKLPGTMTVISSNKDWTWGIDKGQNIYITKDPSGTWKKMDGKAKWVEVGPENVWIIGTDKKTYKRPADGSGKWKLMEGNFTQLSISPTGQLWGINDSSTNNIWYCSKTKNEDCAGGWHRPPGFTSTAKHIDAGQDVVVATTTDNKVIERPVDGTSGVWSIIPGNFRYVVADKDVLYGLDPVGDLSSCKIPCKGKWLKLDAGSAGKMDLIDLKGTGLLGISQGNIWKGDLN